MSLVDQTNCFYCLLFNNQSIKSLLHAFPDLSYHFFKHTLTKGQNRNQPMSNILFKQTSISMPSVNNLSLSHNRSQTFAQLISNTVGYFLCSCYFLFFMLLFNFFFVINEFYNPFEKLFCTSNLKAFSFKTLSMKIQRFRVDNLIFISINKLFVFTDTTVQQ